MEQWVYDLATFEFVYGGGGKNPPHDPLTQGVVTLPEAPDVVRDRYDSTRGIRPATAQELAAVLEREKDKQAELEVGKIVLQAVGKTILDRLDQAISVLNQCRQDPTNQHTQRPALQPIDRTQFWTDVKSHYKSLLP
jgi:hypothetical protein